MPDGAAPPALLKLMTWLSPAFPVGAFSYSHGIERAIHDGVIDDRESLVGWLTDIVERGSGWNDAVLLTEAWRAVAEGRGCAEVAELAEAIAGSRERHMETTLQGEAFLDAIQSWEASRSTLPPSGLPAISPTRGEIGSCDASPIANAVEQATKATRMISPVVGEMAGRPEGGNVERQVRLQSQTEASGSYPVAVARAAAANIDLKPTLAAYLHAFISNLIQAAVRLVPLGQRDGVAAIAAMEPVILATAERAARSTLDDLGSATFMSEIMSMRHETQYSRVFRS